MMYLFYRHELALLLAQLTQRVFTCVAVTDAFPGSAITFPYGGVSVVGFVTLGFSLAVFLTEPPICKPWTAGVRTRSLGFLGHCFTSYGTVDPACI